MSQTAAKVPSYRKFRLGRRMIRLRTDFLRFAADLPPDEKFFDGLRGPFSPVNSASTSRVHRCRISFGGTCLDLYLKQHLHRNLRDYFKHLIRPSRAMREFKASQMLAENGFDTPAMIAVGRIGAGLLENRNFLITARLDSARALYVWLQQRVPSDIRDTLQMRRSLIRQLGETIGRMHASGICHGDLRPGNVFAEEESGRWRFFFLDNERTRKFLYLPRSLVVKNLVQIGMLPEYGVTRTDRLRFLKGYLAADRRFAARYKSFAAEVFARTAARLKAKEIRRGRQSAGAKTTSIP